jgi:hypothetical protein
MAIKSLAREGTRRSTTRSSFACAAVLVSLGALLFACESAATLGASCTRASECSSPLVCRLARCRTECAAARDCGPGQVCLINGAGEGACEIPAIDACSLSCDPPLVCASGHCRVECAVDADCPEGHGCASGACQRSDSTPDAGGSDAARDAPLPDAPLPDAGFSCDPIGGTGCTGERCGLVDGATTCVALGGTVALGAACIAEADCSAGLSCQGERCVRVCRIGDDAACGDDLICSRDSVAGQDFLPGESALGLCTESCDLGSSIGCPPSSTCAIGVGSGGRDFTWCRELGGGAEGAACGNDLACGALLRCYMGACRTFCTIPGGTCEADFHCDGTTEFIARPQYGACIPN